MLPCYEGYVWLILDMPCSLGIVAGQRFGRFQPEPSQNQDCLQPAQTTAGPFDIFHMDPMSDVTMLCRLCVWLILDMPCPLGTVAGQSLADFSQSQAKINQGCLQPERTAGPFDNLHMGPMSDLPML
jgi:hypothetical protein